VSGEAVACEKGFYNPGNNNRRCSKCPGGLDTPTGSQSDPTACVAPPGYYYLRGKAVACAQGSYKTDYNNTDCMQCPEGTTTEPGKVAKTAAADCAYVMPGYYNDAGGSFVAGTTEGTLCPANKYQALTALATSITSCTDCGDNPASNLKTPPQVTGATSPNDCMAPPGFGFFAGTNPSATACSNGMYKSGWNREVCQSCGTSYTTDTDPVTGGAKSADECYVPAGWGAVFTGTTWVATACPVNSYGRPNVTYGLIELECPKCIDNTNTNGTNTATGPDACGTDPGYGYYNGEATKCDFGSWNAGHNQQPCTACGVGYNTTALNSVDGSGVEGASDAAQCQIGQGYEPDSLNLAPKPCDKGYWKDTINATACTVCPLGTTTSVSSGAIARTDCDSCRAGFGAASIDLSNPSCTICGTGKYAMGVAVGPAACADCTKPSDYTGAMVSRNGISSQAQCLQEFPTSPTSTTNKLEWDILTTGSALEAATSDATISDCQAACKLSNECIYFQFNYTGNTGCQLLKAGGDVSARPTDFDGVTVDSPASAWLLLEVKAGSYAVYKVTTAAKANVGDTITGTHTTYAAAKAECDSKSSCAGFAWNLSNWRTFAGKKWLNFIGKPRTFGPAVDPWVAEPTP
jgi:hypothetical protein